MGKRLWRVMIAVILAAFVSGVQPSISLSSSEESPVTAPNQRDVVENMSTAPVCAGESCQPTEIPPMSSPSKLVVYYFHTTFRCPTCQKMEQYAMEVIEKDFKDALASGKLAFNIVNVESQGNEHYVNDYQLYTKALVLSLTKDGKEVRSKNLDKIWEYVRNKDRYKNYVRDEIAAFLKET